MRHESGGVLSRELDHVVAVRGKMLLVELRENKGQPELVLIGLSVGRHARQVLREGVLLDVVLVVDDEHDVGEFHALTRGGGTLTHDAEHGAEHHARVLLVKDELRAVGKEIAEVRHELEV